MKMSADAVGAAHAHAIATSHEARIALRAAGRRHDTARRARLWGANLRGFVITVSRNPIPKAPPRRRNRAETESWKHFGGESVESTGRIHMPRLSRSAAFSTLL
jgi:hypothetical protein